MSNDVSVWVAPAFIKSNGKKRPKTNQYIPTFLILVNKVGKSESLSHFTVCNFTFSVQSLSVDNGNNDKIQVERESERERGKRKKEM